MKPIRVKHALHGPWWVGDEQREGPPPGLLHGDAWDETTGAIQRGNHGKIVGIVDLMARTRYGFSSRGVPQYLFHPADPKWPPMIVGSKAPTTENQWGVVSTKDLVWSTTKGRWPIVQLQQLLGPVGNPEIEAKALLLRFLRPISGPAVWNDTPSENLGQLETWERVFNIDPAGCRDVDDCIAWRTVAPGVHEFAVAIANVAA